MEIIPVIDLLHGQVVHAKRGERHLYRPIESILCKSCEPQHIIQALLGLYPFNTLYIADLDAIQGQGNHLQAIAGIRERYPHLSIWLDAGIRHPAEFESWHELGLHPIVGSENLRTRQQCLLMQDALATPDALLSLDFAGNEFLGNPELLANTTRWPARLIAMNLAKVGSQEGPDTNLLQALRLRAGERKLYAAGGIRNIGDLQRLQALGVAGALVASALHNGHINAQHLCK